MTATPFAFRIEAGNGRRFRRVARAAWRLIPSSEQQQVETACRTWGTCFVLSDRWPGWRAGLHAQVQGRRQAGVIHVPEVRFCAPYLDRMSEALGQDTVLHECVHLLQLAQGRWDADARDALEREADECAERWIMARMKLGPFITVPYARYLNADHAETASRA